MTTRNEVYEAIETLLNAGVARVKINGTIVSFTLAGSLDLEEELPGCYRDDNISNWNDKTPHVEWQKSIGAVAIGMEKNPDDRSHFLVKYFFESK